jgi:putative flippase GtrA
METHKSTKMEAILKSPAILFFVNLLRKIRNPELRSLISFFLTAVLGASVNFFSQIPFHTLFERMALEYPLQWSVFAGYLMATIVSFYPQKSLVFAAKDSGKAKRELIKYVIIAFSALVIQELFTTWAIKYIAEPFYPKSSVLFKMKSSHLIGMCFSFLANYYGHKFLTFRSTGIYDKVRNSGNK